MINKSFHLMGTKINLCLERYHESDGVLAYSYDMLTDYEKRFSANNEESDLCKINKNAGIKPVKVADDLFELIKIGKQASLDSNLKLNIAIGALVKLWHIGFNKPRVPEQTEIEQTLNLINPSDIELNETKKNVFLKKQGMKLDLGAVAKGYFADKLKEYWLKQGVKNGLIDLGRNIQTIGGSKTSNYDCWRIAIQNPFRQNEVYNMPLEISNKSIVTSGTYQKFFEYNGFRYHHILSSQTGMPINTDIVSISVIANSSLQAEILSTSLIALKTSEILEQIKYLDGVEVIIIDKFKKIVSSIR